MTPTLTVFTPTFNRAYTLALCYESLKRQTCQDFVWLIIDDGSTDGTKALVSGWMAEDKIAIRYIYQNNQGMHGAHNTAYENIDTELNVCIDSDDYMPDDAVEKIVSFWRRHGSDRVAGLVGLDATFGGEIIGTRLPEEIRTAKLSDLYEKHHVKGDKKLVYRSALTKRIAPYPIFPGERYCPLAYKYLLIDQSYPLLIMNEVLCHVEYLPDGSSHNMIRQYLNNPRGFTVYRQASMTYAPTLKARFRAAIHYVSSQLLMRNGHFLAESPNKIITLFAIPLGIALYIYIHATRKSTVFNSGSG